MPVAVGVIADSYNKPAAGGGLPVAGALAWWDASDASTITASAGTVSQWRDKSGNLRHLAVTSGAPKTGIRTQNGLNVIDLVAEQLDSPVVTQVQPITILAAMANDASWGSLLAHISGGSPPSMTTGNGQWSMYAGLSLVDGAYDSAAHVWTCLFKSTTSQMWLDGVSKVTGDAWSTGYTGHGVRIGTGWNGMLAELVIYPKELTTPERQSVETYLKTKWGTP